VRRVYGAVDMGWRPFEAWDNQLTIGIDQSLEGNESRNRSTNASIGHTRDRITRDFDQISARYLGSIRYPRTGSLTSNLSFGAEARRDGVHLLSLQATGLPSGAIDGFGFAQQATITSEVSTAIGVVGFFVQEQVGIRDKLFLTAGLRADGSSAFGSNFGLQLYPKVSAAYILEPTSWWTTKLRAAWGRSGQLPEPFAHEMTFRLLRDFSSGLPTLRIAEIGNEDLRAEVGSEIEIGAEQYFFGNRASLELNYFRQTTTDAMLRSSVSPFFGVPAGPLTNLGNLRSQGVELSGQAMMADRSDFSLRLGFNITRMIDNGLVTRLNGLDELFAGNRQDWRFLFGIKEGRSMHALRFYNRESLVRSDTTAIYEFLGSSTPTTYGGFNTDLQLFRDFRLTSHWTYGLGGRGIDGNSISRDSDAGLIVTNYGAFQPEVMTSRYVHSTDHLRFDALRLTYSLSPSLLRGLVDHADLWVEGRNLALFDRWPSCDPTQISVEGGRGGGQFYTGFSQQSVPRPRDYLVGMRVGF
jgi:TonB-dependent starch-binding outer membrane protein SusC